MQLDKERLQEILQKELDGQEDSVGRGVWTVDHCQRVANLAVLLRMATGAPAEMDDLVYLAGLFHDVSHDCVTHDMHSKIGAERFQQLLSGTVDADLLENAGEIISVHDDRQQNDGRSMATHLVQDADLLDHFGTLTIWANFGYSALHGGRMQQSLEFYQKDREKRSYYMKLLHFDAAREELSRRLEFEVQFFERAVRECAGQLTD